MGLDDLFEQQDLHRHHGGYRAGSNVRRDSTNGHNKQDLIYLLLNKIWSNKKLRVLFIVLAIALLLLAILLIVSLIPLILKLIDYVAQNGIQGIVDSIISFINKIWKGAGK